MKYKILFTPNTATVSGRFFNLLLTFQQYRNKWQVSLMLTSNTKSNGTKNVKQPENKVTVQHIWHEHYSWNTKKFFVWQYPLIIVWKFCKLQEAWPYGKHCPFIATLQDSVPDNRIVDLFMSCVLFKQTKYPFCRFCYFLGFITHWHHTIIGFLRWWRSQRILHFRNA